MKLQILPLALTILDCMSHARAQNISLLTALEDDPQLSNLTTYLSLFPDLLSYLEGLSNATILAPNNDAFVLARSSDAGVPGTLEQLTTLFVSKNL